MELKPGYKQTEVGVIPDDWEVKTVRSVGEIRTGPFGTLLKAAEYSGSEGVPLISVGEIGVGRILIDDGTPRVPTEVVRRLPQYILKEGDIVFGRKGAVDRSAMVTAEEDGWFLGSDGIAIRPKKHCFAPYLAWQFQRSEVRNWLVQNATGTTMASLNQDILSKVLIPYAPLPEQRAIAGALSDTDSVLFVLDRLLTKKRDIKQAVMQQFLTGKQRLPGFSGEWGCEPLGKLVRITKGQQLNRAELSSSTGFPAWNGGVEPSGFTDTWNTSENTITISEGGNSCGFVGFVNQKFWCGGHCYALLDVRADLDKVFLYYLLKSKQQSIMGLRMGSGLPNIQRKYLFELLLVYPTLPEQTAITAVLSDLDAEIDALQRRRNKTRAIKQGMMQELLTGRTRLV